MKPKLSKQQYNCLQYLLKGFKTREIAKLMELSPKTVEHYLDAAKAKFNCTTRLELVAKAILSDIFTRKNATIIEPCYFNKGYPKESTVEKINLNEKLKLFNDYWSPKIIGDLNESYVKLAKFKGEFIWHKHDHEDEFFFVIKGTLLIKLRDKDVYIKEGEFLIIPKGVEHLPIAHEEVHVMLIEPKSTLNTGDAESEFKKEKLDRI